MGNRPRPTSIIALVLAVLISLTGCDETTPLPGLTPGDEMLLGWSGVYDQFPNQSIWFIPPKEGQAFYHSLEEKTLVWIDNPIFSDGGNWEALITCGSGQVRLGTAPNFPTSSSRGDLFFDSTSRDSYVYDGSAWRLVTGIGSYGPSGSPNWKGSLPEAPDGPSEGWAYHDETSDLAYTYANGAWKVISIDGQSVRWLGNLNEEPTIPSSDDMSLSNIMYRNTSDGNVYTWFNSSFWRVGNFLELHYAPPQT